MAITRYLGNHMITPVPMKHTWRIWCRLYMNPRIFLKQERHTTAMTSLQWRHNERDGVSNHQPHDYLLSRYSRRRSKKTPKLRVTGIWEGNSPVTGEFPAQRITDAENVSIWWHYHDISRDVLHMILHLVPFHRTLSVVCLGTCCRHVRTPDPRHRRVYSRVFPGRYKYTPTTPALPQGSSGHQAILALRPSQIGIAEPHVVHDCK